MWPSCLHIGITRAQDSALRTSFSELWSNHVLVFLFWVSWSSTMVWPAALEAAGLERAACATTLVALRGAAGLLAPGVFLPMPRGGAIGAGGGGAFARAA
jgi:hypothetical protein